MTNQFTPLLDRFNASYTPEPNSGCWLWAGAASRVRNDWRPVMNRNGGSVIVSRIAYELFKGPIPSGLFVCHSCDVTLCVNPDHLFLGTARDNYYDSKAKGRTAMQRDPGHADRIIAMSAATPQDQYLKRKKWIIPHEDVPAIIKRIEAKETLQSIANDYGVSKAALGTFVTREHLRLLKVQNEKMREALAKLVTTSQLLLQNAEGCAVNHYGHDFQTLGAPGWLADCGKVIEAARSALGEARVSDDERGR